jgi:hypothetical protein
MSGPKHVVGINIYVCVYVCVCDPKYMCNRYVALLDEIGEKGKQSIQFTHQQMHYLLNLERFKIYIKIHTKNIAPTCFGLRPSSGSLY